MVSLCSGQCDHRPCQLCSQLAELEAVFGKSTQYGLSMLLHTSAVRNICGQFLVIELIIFNANDPCMQSIISSVSGEQWTTIQSVNHAVNLWQGECSKSDSNKISRSERIYQLVTMKTTGFLIYSPLLAFVFLRTYYHSLMYMDNLSISII